MIGPSKLAPWTALVLALSLAACSRTAASSRSAEPAKDPAKDESSVATVDGVAITRAELDTKAGGTLARIRDEEYQARRDALEELVMEKLLDREARARGVTREDLFRQEVDAKVPKTTPQEIAAVYEGNKGRMGGRSLAEMTPQIERSIQQQKAAELAQAYMESLRGKANVKIALEQPRVDVAVPAGAAALGPDKAPVTLVEFSDYLCPYCQHAEQVVDEVLAKNQGRVRFVHRDFLLGRPRSMAAARAGQCAREQGKFWEYRKDMLNRPGDWTDEDFLARAKGLGLDSTQFQGCLASDRHDQEIKDSSEQGQSLGVTATPTFFLNGRRIQGVKSASQFQEVIDAELKPGS